MSEAQKQADIQRAEAKRLLNSAIGLLDGTASSTVDMAVDCIIGAALLEITSIYEQANGIFLAKRCGR